MPRLSINISQHLVTLFVLALLGASGCVTDKNIASGQHQAQVFDVCQFGARGDGKALDSDAINRAVDACDRSGGGRVYFPPGQYLCVSIRLKSNVLLDLDHAATIIAAEPSETVKYDPAEPNPAGVPDPAKPWQDFGHSHWHNSLIWGEGLDNVGIVGTGAIWGKGLVKTNGPKNDVGNKAIALKLCRNVTLKDFTIQHGGWFGILATGVDNLTIDNLKIDTNRDGIDLDACRNVRVSRCSVNSPYDDAICPKSSMALGEARSCENITIDSCFVSGFTEGTMLDGTFKPLEGKRTGPVGRIKCGTESNGGFKNIAISNCVFSNCYGLALESVDGAILEDIAISNITMREIHGAPIFVRLGSRMRGPADLPVGKVRRVLIENVVCSSAGPAQGCVISGIPGHNVEDVKLSNILMTYRGGGTAEQAALDPPEKEAAYPDPDMFGPLPSYGLFARHARGLVLHDVDFRLEADDARSPFWLRDVHDVDLRFVRSQVSAPSLPRFVLNEVSGLWALDVDGMTQDSARLRGTSTQPTAVDLQPRLKELGLLPRRQGARGTCSVFTTAAAIEFAVSMKRGKAVELSPEFLNWAADQATNNPNGDGHFFHELIQGYRQFGICAEELMPYQAVFSAAARPSDPAIADAKKLNDDHELKFHWIKPWAANDRGLSPRHMQEIRRVLASGYPVASGASHSRLLVGYKDDPAAPGGGIFLTKDSGSGRFDSITYDFAIKEICDAFWVE